MSAAGSSAAAAAAAAADGPVMSMMNKRLRALRKKYNRILQMEESVAQGKTLNKEQEEVLRSKPAVIVLIEEYERLRQPLSSAVEEELSLSACHASAPSSPPASASADTSPFTDQEEERCRDTEASVEDLLKLLYFSNLFDVKPQSDYETTMLMRTHERGCCITYDTVTDETTSLLEERDLDFISTLGTLVLSRPLNSNISHKNAMLECLQHAKLWLQNSDLPIKPGSHFTYAGLRERLNRILASDYATATPEIKPSVDLAAAVGKYASSELQVADYAVPLSPNQVESSTDHYQTDIYQSKDDISTNTRGNETTFVHSNLTDELSKQNCSDTVNLGFETSVHQEDDHLLAHEEHIQSVDDSMEQQYLSRRSYQNQRGGTRGGSGLRRGYGSARGGRGGRGGYQNGRGQYNDSGYFPRNYYNPRGRSGRGGGAAAYNDHGASGHSGRSSVELSTN